MLSLPSIADLTSGIYQDARASSYPGLASHEKLKNNPMPPTLTPRPLIELPRQVRLHTPQRYQAHKAAPAQLALQRAPSQVPSQVAVPMQHMAQRHQDLTPRHQDMAQRQQELAQRQQELSQRQREMVQSAQMSQMAPMPQVSQMQMQMQQNMMMVTPMTPPMGKFVRKRCASNGDWDWSDWRMTPVVHFPVVPLEAALGLPQEEYVRLQSTIYPSITTKKYCASALDPTRLHLVVYEYPLGGRWVIWDCETGYVHLTGLWRAALQEQAMEQLRAGVPSVRPNTKADIIKLLELTPKDLHQCIKRVRGGLLKIQGTWLPHRLCEQLARRFCYYIRFLLVPIFGPAFPLRCLAPQDEGFGELRFDNIDMSQVPTQPTPMARVPRVVWRSMSAPEPFPAIESYKHPRKKQKREEPEQCGVRLEGRLERKDPRLSAQYAEPMYLWCAGVGLEDKMRIRHLIT